MKTFVQYTVVMLLTAISLCFIFAVPEESSESFVLEVLWSKTIAVITGYIAYKLAMLWNIENIREVINETI